MTADIAGAKAALSHLDIEEKEVAIKAERMTLVIRLLTEEYFLAITLKPGVAHVSTVARSFLA